MRQMRKYDVFFDEFDDASGAEYAIHFLKYSLPLILGYSSRYRLDMDMIKLVVFEGQLRGEKIAVRPSYP